MGVCLHPGQQQDEGKPAACIVKDARTDSVQDGKQTQGEIDSDNSVGGGVCAVSGRGNNQILAASKRTKLIDRARAVHEKWAGDALIEVVKDDVAGAGGITDPVFGLDAVVEAGGGKLLKRGAEAVSESVLLRRRHGPNREGERFCFKQRYRDQVVATGGTCLPAGDRLPSAG